MVDQYAQLLDLRRSEGAARGLSKIPVDFYHATQGYLDDLRRTFESELRENPGGRRGDLARQTHARASQLARDIVEARTTKLLSSAFQASVGGSKEIANALPEERALFDRVCNELKAFRTGSAPYLEPRTREGPATTPPVPSGRPPTEPPSGGEHRNAPSLATGATVRMLADGKPVELKGEVIDLRKEDLITLPNETAQLLVDSKLAERVMPREPRSTT